MSFIVTVEYATYDMLNWLENSDIEYHVTLRFKDGPGSIKMVPEMVHDIVFKNETDIFYFQLGWGEEII